MFRKLMFVMFALVAVGLLFTSCIDQEDRDRRMVDNQQEHLRKVHPIPWFDYSRELEIYRQIYMSRNLQVATHTVWRSDYGLIEGDCPSLGFPIPYDSQMTNPVRHDHQAAVIEQAEPNGLFTSKNTAATWAPCVDEDGNIAPVYIESKVTSYPYPVLVDYEKNRVKPAPGVRPSIQIKVNVSNDKLQTREYVPSE